MPCCKCYVRHSGLHVSWCGGETSNRTEGAKPAQAAASWSVRPRARGLEALLVRATSLCPQRAQPTTPAYPHSTAEYHRSHHYFILLHNIRAHPSDTTNRMSATAWTTTATMSSGRAGRGGRGGDRGRPWTRGCGNHINNTTRAGSPSATTSAPTAPSASRGQRGDRARGNNTFTRGAGTTRGRGQGPRAGGNVRGRGNIMYEPP